LAIAAAGKRRGLGEAHHRGRWFALAALLLLAGGFWGVRAIARARLATRLLTTLPYEIEQHPELVRYAMSVAPGVYRANCASCHGADMKGETAKGAPNLIDPYWLYGDGSVAAIERTILYGIRAGHGQTRNVTEMTAFGLTGQLNSSEVNQAVQYLLELNHRPFNQEDADAGQNLFFGKAACFDCHGADARGEPNYGAPNLTIDVWNNGPTEADLYHDIYFGIHHVCPAWVNKLTLGQIRALAVTFHTLSFHEEKKS
jgi:cytochrome c oxidase cbb3-type subunit 3